MIRLSEKQTTMLEAIKEHVKQHNYPPTVRELAEIAGLRSSSTVHGYLHRLKKRGLIEWEPGRPRTLKIIKLQEVAIHDVAKISR